MMSTTTHGAPAGASPTASPAVDPAGAPPTLVVNRWISRDGVRNSIACAAIAIEPCDECGTPYTVDTLTPVMGHGLLCPTCWDRLRVELMTR